MVDHLLCKLTLGSPEVLTSLAAQDAASVLAGPEAAGSPPPLVGSIDQGTSSTRYIIFNKQGDVVASAQMEHTQIFPKGADKVGCVITTRNQIMIKTSRITLIIFVFALFRLVGMNTILWKFMRTYVVV